MFVSDALTCAILRADDVEDLGIVEASQVDTPVDVFNPPKEIMIMPKPRVYGTPVGIAGGPSEKPSSSQGRQKARPASDAQVKAAVGKEMARSKKAASSPPSTKTSKNTDVASGVEALTHPGRRTRKALDDMGV